MTEVPALVLEGFGVAFGERVILAEVDLTVPPVGVVNLMGPTSAGKSTLLRTLAGLNDAQPALRTWGRVRIEGREASLEKRRRDDGARTDEARRIALVRQNARFYIESVRENLVSALPDRSQLTRLEQDERVRAMLHDNRLHSLESHFTDRAVTLSLGQQRCLAILRAVAGDPALLFVDEPTVSVDHPEAVQILELIRLQATQRAVLTITHNRRHAIYAGGTVVLLAGGRVLERAPVETFFDAPRTAAARAFVRTGSCAVPSPDARPEELAEGVEPPPPLPPQAAAAPPASVGPRGFFWLHRGRLGGLPRPGISADLAYDLEGLVALGVTHLITLEETRTVPTERLAELGIQSAWLPVDDMHAPTVEAALAHCERVASLMREGAVVAIHCKAGLGRTGTLLAAQLIHEGASSVDAVEQARQINPRWIQSDEQLDFLVALADAVRAEA